jgi:SAM-dependent methyltransferase
MRRPPDHYGGTRIAAAPGTHAAIAAMAAKYVSPEASVLDLGAYKGALIARLRDQGFTSLAAADLENHLVIDGVDHVACDFNQPFARKFGGAQFDCIVTSEVIEHLDDVRAFLGECSALLRDGGTLVLSTPNIGFFEGRVKFFLTGELWGFGAKNYRSQRHISAISLEQMPLVLGEAGFETREVFTTASFATTLRKLLTMPIWLPMRLLLGPHVLGETTVCVGRKSADARSDYLSGALWGSAVGA